MTHSELDQYEVMRGAPESTRAAKFIGPGPLLGMEGAVLMRDPQVKGPSAVAARLLALTAAPFSV